MNSFYGGKEGRSYAIIKHFDSVIDMVNQFKKGAGYTEVSYGEYVIIDTIVNRNNPNDVDNGKIYRRGLNFSDETTGGAIYVGQIQGTEGKIPHLDFVSMSELKSYDDIDGDGKVIVDGTIYQVVDNGQILSLPSADLDSIYSNGSTHRIQLGYKTIADEDGANRKGMIGLEVPNPIVKVSAQIVSPISGVTYDHKSITNTVDSSTVDFSNPINQHSESIDLAKEGVQYYDYQIAIPKSADNIKVSASTQVQDNGVLQLEYDTISNNAPVHITANLSSVNVVDGLRSVQGSDVYEYHLSGKEEWQFLGNPNGQFHIYAKYGLDNPFNSPSDVISFLNEEYPFGIRIPIFENGSTTTIKEYDLAQAGWVISAEIQQGSTVAGQEAHIHSSLFAFDYRGENGPISLSLLKAANLSTEVQLKGWFQVQQFQSSFTSSPQQIILIGDRSNDVNTPDFGVISSGERNKLQMRGLWLESEAGEKWWL